MEIRPPKSFWHAGDLNSRFAGNDPRSPSFRGGLDIDLRGCEFVRPPAVLWCAVYPLLAAARGIRCRLLVPENLGVCIYLRSVGLFHLLQQAAIELNDRDIGDRRDPQLVLPLTRFWRESEAEELANQALEALHDSGLGATNMYAPVTEAFGELAINAVQHAESEIGAFGLIQFYESQRGNRFVCCVADGGIGIRRSLERNPELRDRVPYDWVAIEEALKERVSGTGERTRGIGLYSIAEDMRKAGRQLIIHSGLGMLRTSEDLEERPPERTTLFPGTLAYASIPT